MLSFEFCPRLLFSSPLAYLSSSLVCPTGARQCCISFVAPPLSIQRPTPLAHLGKTDLTTNHRHFHFPVFAPWFFQCAPSTIEKFLSL